LPGMRLRRVSSFTVPPLKVFFLLELGLFTAFENLPSVG
jgi:hypothetical protein